MGQAENYRKIFSFQMFRHDRERIRLREQAQTIPCAIPRSSRLSRNINTQNWRLEHSVPCKFAHYFATYRTAGAAPGHGRPNDASNQNSTGTHARCLCLPSVPFPRQPWRRGRRAARLLSERQERPKRGVGSTSSSNASRAEPRARASSRAWSRTTPPTRGCRPHPRRHES